MQQPRASGSLRVVHRMLFLRDLTAAAEAARRRARESPAAPEGPGSVGKLLAGNPVFEITHVRALGTVVAVAERLGAASLVLDDGTGILVVDAPQAMVRGRAIATPTSLSPCVTQDTQGTAKTGGGSAGGDAGDGEDGAADDTDWDPGALVGMCVDVTAVWLAEAFVATGWHVVRDPHSEPLRHLDIARLYREYYFPADFARAEPEPSSLATAPSRAGAGGKENGGTLVNSGPAGAGATSKRPRWDACVPLGVENGEVEGMVREAGHDGVAVESIALHFGVSRDAIEAVLGELILEGAIYKTDPDHAVAL